MSTVEIYVLSNERSSEIGHKFLDHFLPKRDEVASEYIFPEFADNAEITFFEVSELMRKLDKETKEGYSIYWDNQAMDDPSQAMLFYTEDGHLVAGLVVQEADSKDWLIELKRFFEANFGYMSVEGVPPETKSEFIELCQSSNYLKIIDSKIIE